MSKSNEFGYARVSSADQNEGRQIQALLEVGVKESFIFTDKMSGKDFNRTEYQFLVGSRLAEGDTLIITSIDRLGRNYTEIMEEWRRITREIKANIKVLDMPLLDTTKSGADLDQTFIADLVLQILSYVANKERDNIRKRQEQGIALARQNGVSLGRPKAIYPDNWNEIYQEWKSELITATEAMKRLNLRRTTFYKLIKEYRTQSV